jgi:glutamine amidotransferase
MPESIDVTVIDLGIGNIKSVANMLDRIGVESKIAEKPSEMKDNSPVVLPGVGSFDEGANRLRRSGWDSWLKEAAEAKQKILGLCLGMQLLCEGSDEGELGGLALLPGRFVRFPSQNELGDSLKIPHMGWNSVEFDSRTSPWVRALDVNSRFYFVHSYHYLAEEGSQIVSGWTNYGGAFASVLQKDNIIGIQFHPEKSHRFGMELLKAVVEAERV